MFDKFLFALEKLLAVVLSQRTAVSVVGLIVIGIAVAAAIGPLFNIVVNAPSEEDIAAQVSAILGGAAVVITAIINVVKVVGPLIVSIQENPPSFRREDYSDTSSARLRS